MRTGAREMTMVSRPANDAGTKGEPEVGVIEEEMPGPWLLRPAARLGRDEREAVGIAQRIGTTPRGFKGLGRFSP